MRAGDRLVHRAHHGPCESVIVRVYYATAGEADSWTLALAQGCGVTQERLEPRDVVEVSDGVWRLRREVES